MSEQTQSVTVRLPVDLIRQMDDLRTKQAYEPTRTQVIETALREHVRVVSSNKVVRVK